MKAIGACLAALAGAAIVWAGMAHAAESVPAGQKLFLDYKCNSCHSLKAAKIEKKKVVAAEEEEAAAADTGPKKEPPDLSGTGLTRKAEWIEGWLMKKELIDGKKHKKKFRGTPQELKTVSAWLATMKTKVEPEKPVAK